MTISTTSQLPPALAQPIDVLMIDNFDSFTWNLYQQLSLLGAEVTVIRNDAISPEVFPLLSINFLIVSPGPGHPRTDSGISKAAIKYFQGKVPILGVCMGLECMVDLYGGEIGYAGEIMHGKTSKLKHDNRGCFKGVPQGIESTRYHSLSAAHTTLPDDLAITSITEDSGVIMGVRHRKYTIEAVQYHPESILSQGGDDLIRNFLSLRGGLWQTNPESGVLDSTLPPFDIDSLPKQDASHQDKTKIPSILDKIYAQRLQDVALARSTHGTTFADLQTLLTLNIPPALIQVLPRVTQTPPGRPALFAEIKRASPSKGPISVTTSPAAQALTYALAGAHLISVLTEPKWFLGSLHDMLQARMSVDHLSNRPVILRKDFILSRYQVLESRIWGADTILLIASMLPEVLLRDLYAYSVSLGMEPLVEVNNSQEMELALSIPAKIIGVNNRNLHDFNVDMRTTSRLSRMVKGRSDVVLCALSGISGAFDVDTYAKQGVHAVLVGESLMRAADPALFIQELLSLPASPKPRVTGTVPLVKICGIRSEEEAIAIAEAGADILGLMFVEKSKRYVTLDTAREISQAVRSMRYSHPPDPLAPSDKTQNVCTPWLTYHANQLSSSASPFPPNNTRTGPATRPLLVGVFQDAPLAHVLYAVAHAQLDMVQLHGNEPTEWANRIPVPVIRVFHVAPAGQGVGKVMNTRNGRHNEKDDDGTLANGTGSNTELNSGSMTKAAAGSLTGALRDANSLVPGITLGGAHHFVLLDSMRDDGSGKSGGSGRIVDWELARQVVELGEVGVQVGGTQDSQSRYPLPIILAGGLTPENVAEAVIQVGPWGVDVSGGVETPDGRGKDLEKVRAFVRNAKGAVSQMATTKGVRGEQA